MGSGTSTTRSASLEVVLWAVVVVIGKLQHDTTVTSKKYRYSVHKLGYDSTRLGA